MLMMAMRCGAHRTAWLIQSPRTWFSKMTHTHSTKCMAMVYESALGAAIKNMMDYNMKSRRLFRPSGSEI
jgi:hypothetical protein